MGRPCNTVLISWMKTLRLRRIKKLVQNPLGSSGQTQDPIPGLLTPILAPPHTHTYIRDILKAAGDFPWSEWYPSWCSHDGCLTTLSLGSVCQPLPSQIMLMWCDVSLHPPSGVVSPILAPGEVCFQGTYCPVLFLLPLHFTLDFHQDPWVSTIPSWPWTTCSLQVAKPLPPEGQAVCQDHILFSYEKCLWKRISPSVSTINTNAHISLECSLLSFAASLRGLGSSFPGMGRAGSRLEALDSIGWSLGQKCVLFFLSFSVFTLLQTHNVPLSFCVHDANTFKWKVNNALRKSQGHSFLDVKPKSWSDSAFSPPPKAMVV